METVEESMNDTAHLLASSVEESFKNSVPSDLQFKNKIKNFFEPIFSNTRKKEFDAKIYSLTKTKSNLQIYVTDNQGIVIYDSEGIRTGLDYSKFNDVYLTLQGKYGARSSKLEGNTSESALFVAAPIKVKNQIYGVLTLIKPKMSVVPFIELAKQKFLNLTIIVAVFIAFSFMLLTFFFFRPIRKLSTYVQSLKKGEKSEFPSLGIKEIEQLGYEIDSLVKEIEGKKYIESYIQTLTHEIKSPLSSIFASAELLPNHPDELIHLTENIQKESQRIQKLIEQLMELSSLEGKGPAVLNETVNLEVILNDVIKLFEAECNLRKIKLLKSLSPIFMKGNTQYLKICFQNLLRNAIDFANPNDQIFIFASKTKSQEIEIKIEDQGTSIPDFAFEKIFDRFYSLPRPKTNTKSSGLGLSIVKEILTLHKGKIRIENRKPKGVSVTIIF